jgi:hypothetical protein
MTKQLFSLGILIGLLFACADADVSAKTQRKLKQVKVYLYKHPGEHIDLSPVTRSVNAVAPARGAIEALIAGPTEAEKEQGFGELASASEFRIGSLKIVRGTARINFVSKKSWQGWPGDTAPIRFKTAVELTLKQFPTVKRVVVSLDGDAKFWDES